MGKALEGRVALVTGAGRGIGLAVASRLARDEAAVVVNDVDGDVAKEAADEMVAAGGQAVAAPGSVVDLDDVAAMLGTAQDTFGSLDILVNNAGITADAMAHNMTDEQWNMVCEVALKGTFNLCRAAFPMLRGSREQPPGHHRKVVNMASINGIYGIAGNVNYSAAKGGVIALTKSLAREWARHRINVNAVAPGYIAGTRLTGARDDDTGLGIPKSIIERIEAQIPIGRAGTPEDVAGACAWLASPDSDYATGQVIELHGGREMVELL